MANPMRDDETLIRGLGFYVQDAAPDQALHVAFVRSDHAHAQVLEVDASAALDLPGVVAVWQASDVKGVVTPGVNPLWPPLQDMPMPLLAVPIPAISDKPEKSPAARVVSKLRHTPTSSAKFSMRPSDSIERSASSSATYPVRSPMY